MIKPSDLDIARLFKQRIQVISPVCKLVVFGSRARGDAAPDSDLDIFIEIPELNKHLRSQIHEMAWEIGFEHGLVITTLITTTALLTDSLLSANPIFQVIDVEGVPV
jgi:uncharacterized protein